MKVRSRFMGAIALMASVVFAIVPAHAGEKGGGHGGGHGGGYGNTGGGNAYGGHGGTGIGYGGQGGKGYGGTGYGGTANAVAGITQVFKGNSGGSNYLFGAASIIGALNPAPGPKFIFKNIGNPKVFVTVNVNNGGGHGMPAIYQGPMKGDDGVITTRRPPSGTKSKYKHPCNATEAEECVPNQ
ncbi:MAG: hypothetical protein WAZ27_04065 [Minisyncoccia bacterium]